MDMIATTFDIAIFLSTGGALAACSGRLSPVLRTPRRESDRMLAEILKLSVVVVK
jgi:hypothetical protein